MEWTGSNAMNLHKPGADIYQPENIAAGPVTHLGIGAHQDDLEFMAFHGIWACANRADRGFAGVVCTDGRGSARQGPYADHTDDEMRDVRREEQRMAARLGHYRLMLQLDYSTAELKADASPLLAADLRGILAELQPEVVYIHNPADKHETHLAVFAATLAALRQLPAHARPRSVYGCEGWRGLDWMPDDEKAALDVSGGEDLSARLNDAFASQIAGGKRYDLAVEGRRRANATFSSPHAVDAATHLCLAMDLTPLITDDTLDPVDFTLGVVDRFREDVRRKLKTATARLHGNHHTA